jgi:hypothetical protein
VLASVGNTHINLVDVGIDMDGADCPRIKLHPSNVTVTHARVRTSLPSFLAPCAR